VSQENPEYSLTYLQETAICFVLIQINPVHDIPYHLSKLIQYILALNAQPSPVLSFVQFSPPVFSVSFFLRNACHNLSFFFLIMLFSPASCCFFPLSHKYLPHHPLLSKLSLFSFLNFRLLISLILIFKYFLFFFLKCLHFSHLNINFLI